MNNGQNKQQIKKAISDFYVWQKAGKSYQKNGPSALLRAYGKYKKTAPTSVQTAAAKQSGFVPANPVNAYDTAYMCPVTIGGSTVNLDFDTGSADLWTFSTQQSALSTVSHLLYNTTSSGTLIPGLSWGITYADGSSASGNVYNDTMTVGNVTATGQAIEVATTASSAFTSATYDGILGLGFDTLNMVTPTRQATFFDNVKSSLETALFTANLQKNAPGSYTFGYLNASQYTGPITYAPVDPSAGWWAFNMTGYSTGNAAATPYEPYIGVVDTGTTLLVLPQDIVAAYWGQVANASYSSTYGGWTFPCAATLPSWSAVIGGAAQTVPGSYLNYGPVDNAGNCFGGMQQNDGIGFSIYGDVFLKSQFVVFDQSQATPRVGFAKQVGVDYS
ncbi:aspergillopepsin A precursor [Saccharata proteae CBS 121410]|uniref:Aspergillopepsin A n=1 Tax=Saccharata proteae CBS 121410 TaxID=1314787 RepID=A0A9P4M1H6_9PEZI|nr:aspergillopepsin A precursor [Saccharata proteae CBS 121410]